MKRAEILLLDPPRFEQHHRQRVAHREHGGGTGSRREIERAGLAGDLHVEVNIGFAGQARLGIARQRHKAGSDALEARDQPGDLLRLAAVAEDQHQIAAGDHAEVAVRGVDGIQDHAGRARAGKGRGDLGPDHARFADAGDDDLASRLDDLPHRLHRPAEIIVQAALHRPQRRGLQFDDVPALGDVRLEAGRGRT